MPIAAVITSARPPARLRARSGSRPKRGADALARLCKALEIRIIPTKRRPRENETTAKATLRKILAQHGTAHFVLLVRTIAESEGNSRALVAPIIWAISDVMLAFPAWPNRGLEWLASFDAIDLQSLLKLVRPLCNVSKQKPRAAIAGMLAQQLHPIFSPPARRPFSFAVDELTTGLDGLPSDCQSDLMEFRDAIAFYREDRFTSADLTRTSGLSERAQRELVKLGILG